MLNSTTNVNKCAAWYVLYSAPAAFFCDSVTIILTFITIIIITIIMMQRKKTENNVKPGTHWRQSWIQHGRLCWKSTLTGTGNKSATKSTVAVYVQLCCRYGWLRRQCVRGQSNTVDFVDFQESRACWIQLCRRCVPGFIVKMLAGYEPWKWLWHFGCETAGDATRVWYT